MSWPVVKLSDVAELINGDRSSNYPSGEDIVEEGILFLSTKNIVENKIDLSQKSFITKEKFDSLGRGKLLKNDLIITLRGTLGSCCIFNTEFDTGFINAQMMIIRCKDEVSNRYLHYYLTSLRVNCEFQRANTGSAVPQLTGRQLAELEIPLPPLDEQKRIAAILDKADAIRRKRQQAIQLADDFLRSVFLDMFGDPMVNPMGWTIKPLSELIDKNDRLNYGVVQPGEATENGVPLVRSGDLYDVTPDVNKLRTVSSQVDEKHKRSRLKGNEILIACVGSIGKVGWVTEKMVGWNIARAVTRIPLSSDVNREYIYRYLQSPVIQGYFKQETRAVAQPTLNVGLIGQTPIALPPIELQNEFLVKFELITKSEKKMNDELALNTELFNSLSQKAFAGEL